MCVVVANKFPTATIIILRAKLVEGKTSLLFTRCSANFGAHMLSFSLARHPKKQGREALELGLHEKPYRYRARSPPMCALSQNGYGSMDIIGGYPSMIFIDGYPSMNINGPSG